VRPVRATVRPAPTAGEILHVVLPSPGARRAGARTSEGAAVVRDPRLFEPYDLEPQIEATNDELAALLIAGDRHDVAHTARWRCPACGWGWASSAVTVPRVGRCRAAPTPASCRSPATTLRSNSPLPRASGSSSCLAFVGGERSPSVGGSSAADCRADGTPVVVHITTAHVTRRYVHHRGSGVTAPSPDPARTDRPVGRWRCE
jgi:hypothetical protein